MMVVLALRALGSVRDSKGVPDMRVPASMSQGRRASQPDRADWGRIGGGRDLSDDG